MENLLKNAKTNDVKPDDILDALCAAITAKIGDTQGYKTLPEEPQKDSCNLPIEMIITPQTAFGASLINFKQARKYMKQNKYIYDGVIVCAGACCPRSHAPERGKHFNIIRTL